MTWLFENKQVKEHPDKAIGFVYIIKNKINGKQYIGKKLLEFSKTSYKTVTQKNGVKKKKKIKTKIESDWQSYWGSSELLQEDVSKLGEDKFTRKIIKYCYSKGELSYFEAKYQFEYDVLLNPDKWYNGWISVRVRASQLKNRSEGVV